MHGCDGCLKQETDTLLVSFISLITGNLSLNEGGGRLLQRTGNGLSLKKGIMAFLMFLPNTRACDKSLWTGN